MEWVSTLPGGLCSTCKVPTDEPIRSVLSRESTATRQQAFVTVHIPSGGKVGEQQPQPDLNCTLDEPASHQFFTGKKRRSNSDSNETLSSLTRPKTFRSEARRRSKSIISLLSRIMAPHSVSRRSTRQGDEIPASKKESLYDQLCENMIMKRRCSARFIPESVLTKLLCKEAVISTLTMHQSTLRTGIPELAEFICQRGRKLFAILVWSEAEELIESFYHHRFGDENLPVEVHIPDDADESVDAFCFKLGERSLIKDHPFNSPPWSDRELENFCDTYQWSFLSPVFYEHQFKYELHEKSRMPFVEPKARSRKETYFSAVEEWCIHRGHLQTKKSIGIPKNPDENPCVAIKELKQMTMTDEEFKAVVKSEAETLAMLRQLSHKHLIRAIAYYTKGDKHYVMFPWARGGNLRDFWKKDPPPLNPQYLEWVFGQLTGLAEAIVKLHHSHTSQHWRHGDLKPENILCFEEDDSCTLVIADVGLSKSHGELTEARRDKTHTKAGTIMYEPPESEILADKPRSRRYDIWSIGCIYLEFVVWLLYGTRGLKRVREELDSTAVDGNVRFYVIDSNSNSDQKTFQLNNVIQKWIEHIYSDRRCPRDSAVGRLVDLIVTRLLVAVGSDDDQVPRQRGHRVDSFLSKTDSETGEHSAPLVLISPATFNSGTTTDPFMRVRDTAEDMHQEMVNICHAAKGTTHGWMKWNESFQDAPGLYAKNLTASDAISAIGRSNKEQEVQEINEYKFTPLDDNWEYTHDAEIARHIFADTGLRSVALRTHERAKLCERCGGMQLWRAFSDTLATLRKNSGDCDLCKLLLNRIDDGIRGETGTIWFFRVGSSLTCGDRREQPILSLYRIPGTGPALRLETTSTDIQLGFPTLPDAGSPAHIRTLTEWIRSCDNNHQCYPKDNTFLPTRVVDVGEKGSSSVRLSCDIRGQTRPGKFVALSHRWGTPNQHRLFCTKKENIEQFKESIKMNELPKTFQDAIHVTRALGFQYLWIDSLCIVQDDAEDWAAESRRMEHVFSSAYVTIAASCASGTGDGFLQSRMPRKFVPVTRPNGVQYAFCETIDNFDLDVEKGELNKRGWVLQERALSRRTIFFTKTQTYWECGGAVRCETLTKMKNRKTSFLGDANFPQSVKFDVKGMKIKFYQSLYEKYSNMELSVRSDRPIAIKGLEKRLIRTLDTVGGYGMLQCFWHRCLMWQRSGDSLKRIQEFQDESIPSWSWMAYEGGIKYMDIPFGEVYWENNVISPFIQGSISSGSDEDVLLPFEIQAQVWDIVGPHDQRLILDEPACIQVEPLRCVILGKNKRSEPDPGQIHYVMIVTKAGNGEVDAYERVGVAFLERRQIGLDRPEEPIRIR